MSLMRYPKLRLCYYIPWRPVRAFNGSYSKCFERPLCSKRFLSPHRCLPLHLLIDCFAINCQAMDAPDRSGGGARGFVGPNTHPKARSWGSDRPSLAWQPTMKSPYCARRAATWSFVTPGTAAIDRSARSIRTRSTLSLRNAAASAATLSREAFMSFRASPMFFFARLVGVRPIVAARSPDRRPVRPLMWSRVSRARSSRGRVRCPSCLQRHQ